MKHGPLTIALATLAFSGLFASLPVRAQWTLSTIGHATNFPGGFAVGVAVTGGHAYVANGNDGLRVFDVSNPTNPVCVGHVANSAGGYAEQVGVDDTHAYVANGTNGLCIYDVADPANPFFVTGVSNAGEIAMDLVVSSNHVYVGNYFYISLGHSGMRGYDISSPSNVVEVCHTNIGEQVYDVGLSGQYLCVLAGKSGLFMFDITNPTNLVPVGHTYGPGVGLGMAVFSNRAYVVVGPGGGALTRFSVLDISNPASLADLGNYDNNAVFGGGVAVAGGITFLSQSNGIGLRAFTSANPSNIVNITQMTNSSPGIIHGLTAAGDYIYWANGTNGLNICKLTLAGPHLGRTNNSVVVSWPTNAGALTLQKISDLGTANWLTVSNARGILGSQYQTVLPVSVGGEFYRFQYP